jgi:chemosensory pili system protein ChpA (sensor histidine kinase/response regulator)
MGQTVLFLDARRLVESHIRLLHRPKLTDGRDPSGQAANDARPSRPRVLVVDDSISARKRVVRSLRRYPIDVVEASDGKQALEILKTQQFAAVFSDMEMPHVSGMELLAEINSDNRPEAPPVVIISSRCEDEVTERAKQLGAIRYLPKPLSDNALDGALRGIEGLRRLNTNQSATSQPSMEIQ